MADAEPNPIDGMLLASSAFGRTDDVRTLLQSGAVTNLNVTAPRTSETPLHMASSWGYKEIVRLLLDADAGTEAVDFRGRTALMKAAAGYEISDDHGAVVQMLLQKGAVVNSASGNGFTALHFACEIWKWGEKKLPMVRQLCRAGADCLAQAQTRWGPATPLDLAVHNGDQGVIDFLLQHCSTVTFQRHGNLSLHVILQEIQIVRCAANNDNDNANSNITIPDRYRLSIGNTLRIEHLLKFLDHLIALDSGMLSALNAENKIPIQVAIARRFPEQITFLLVRHYPDSLVHLSY